MQLSSSTVPLFLGTLLATAVAICFVYNGLCGEYGNEYWTVKTRHEAPQNQIQEFCINAIKLPFWMIVVWTTNVVVFVTIIVGSLNKPDQAYVEESQRWIRLMKELLRISLVVSLSLFAILPLTYNFLDLVYGQTCGNEIKQLSDAIASYDWIWEDHIMQMWSDVGEIVFIALQLTFILSVRSGYMFARQAMFSKVCAWLAVVNFYIWINMFEWVEVDISRPMINRERLCELANSTNASQRIKDCACMSADVEYGDFVHNLQFVVPVFATEFYLTAMTNNICLAYVNMVEHIDDDETEEIVEDKSRLPIETRRQTLMVWVGILTGAIGVVSTVLVIMYDQGSHQASQSYIYAYYLMFLAEFICLGVCYKETVWAARVKHLQGEDYAYVAAFCGAVIWSISIALARFARLVTTTEKDTTGYEVIVLIANIINTITTFFQTQVLVNLRQPRNVNTAFRHKAYLVPHVLTISAINILLYISDSVLFSSHSTNRGTNGRFPNAANDLLKNWQPFGGFVFAFMVFNRWHSFLFSLVIASSIWDRRYPLVTELTVQADIVNRAQNDQNAIDERTPLI